MGKQTDNLMVIRQKESYLPTKLAIMLRAEERRPEGDRDQELIATIKRIIEDLKRQRPAWANRPRLKI